MATAPYGVRLLLGVAVTALEETRRLPHTILMYPMTVASTAAHLVMRVQQNVAELVVKGDEALEQLFPPTDEQPEWATFDEDLEPDSSGDEDRHTAGRFALYSTGEPERHDNGAAPPPASTEPEGSAEPPPIVTELGYDSLTLAQLRARLPALKVTDLEALLAYEEATGARAPFQTLLANRITRASAK